MDEPYERTTPPRPSKTPSWVLLGFVLGALVVWTLPRESATSPARPPKTTVVHLDRPKFTDIEAVFGEWGRYAVWYHDLTEVALWDVDLRSYSIYYEVYRAGDVYYFRSIPRLTRPILTHGVHVSSPLQYTETEEMRREWLTKNENLPPRGESTPGDGKE